MVATTRFTRYASALLFVSFLTACGSGNEPTPKPTSSTGSVGDAKNPANAGTETDSQLKAIIAEQGITALQRPRQSSAAQIALGQALFFDKELSGNRDVSCATCHHPLLHTSDHMSVSLGTGGAGLGPARLKGVNRRLIPRNSPELFNRGLAPVNALFWDGRVAGQKATGFQTPAGTDLPSGVESAFAAQAFFPPTSAEEMRGDVGDRDIQGRINEIAALPANDFRGIWSAVMTRLVAIPAYVQLFRAAYPSVATEQLSYTHAANAIAAFEIDRWTAIDTPWDRYVAGDNTALNAEAKQGALLFFGKARCGECHSGALLTDQDFHNIAVPQLGPGKGTSAPFDFGRELVTANEADRYKFKTPPLRNVAITAPYMHNGAYVNLQDAIVHHFDPLASLKNYDSTQLSAELQTTVRNDVATQLAIAKTLDEKSTSALTMSRAEISQLMAFMNALTDPTSLALAKDIPSSVPSGLPVSD